MVDERAEERLEQARELAEAVEVQPVGEGAFTGPSPDWFGPRVFGGFVLAQAVSAAVQTVGDDVVLHSVHTAFLRAVEAGPPVALHVDAWRDGRAFTTRHVVTVQAERVAARTTCSFHRPEEGDEYQLPMPDDVPGPEGQPITDHGGPYEIVELGPTPPAPDGTYCSTRRAWMRIPGVPDDPATHLAVGALLSDLTATSFRPLSLDVWDRHTDASLDHAAWFHRPFRVDEWLYFDLQAVVNTGNRALLRGSLYRRDGALCLSIAQELLIRELERPPS